LDALARFFHVHPRPAQRTRALLSRYLWRSALLNPVAMQVSSIIEGDEFASVERLLASMPEFVLRASRYLCPSASTKWRIRDSGEGRLCALALAHLGPRDPETGETLGTEEIRALLELESVSGVFLDVGGMAESTVVRRVLVSSPAKIEKLPFASLSILESHGLDQEAADALGRGDIATFTERRAAILDRWFQRFFAERIGEGDSDRPPVDELIRRVDKALRAA
jgi:hypothetical protein